jgi:hypothetical protein
MGVVLSLEGWGGRTHARRSTRLRDTLQGAVDLEHAGRDAAGFMRVGVIAGGIRLPPPVAADAGGAR